MAKTINFNISYNNNPQISVRASFQAYANSVKVAIQPVIERNQKIPKNSFCTKPESLVTLETPLRETTWRRQYPSAHMLQPLVDEVVQKRADNSIITQKPVNTTFDSTLNLAPKKDLEGNLMLKRAC
ncbi:hypothetical protein K7432_018083 [Basidiobolus ranarum]|uniref:Uncharacterized protein n=1 Tax=Basidiobolus ranarum TaxID=34480 RepID=A0ABR2VKS2_9FUNG